MMTVAELKEKAVYHRNRASVFWYKKDFAAAAAMNRIADEYERLSPSLPTPAATPTDSANPPPVESVGPNSTGDA